MKAVLIILIFAVFSGPSCSETNGLLSTVKKPSEDECLKRLISSDIDSNMRLSEIPVLVSSVSGGNVKLYLPSSNKRIISDTAVLAIRSGDSPHNIQRTDRSVSLLIDFEKQLQRRPQVKTISWGADEPCKPGFVCQTTGTSQRSAGEDELDALCSEYRN
jgi:hypothetical protein